MFSKQRITFLNHKFPQALWPLEATKSLCDDYNLIWFQVSSKFGMIIQNSPQSLTFHISPLSVLVVCSLWLFFLPTRLPLVPLILLSHPITLLGCDSSFAYSVVGVSEWSYPYSLPSKIQCSIHRGYFSFIPVSFTIFARDSWTACGPKILRRLL